MTTIDISFGRRHFSLLAVLMVVGLFGPQRLLIAQEAAADSRQKVIEALRVARQEYVNVALEDEKRVLTEVYLAERSQKTSATGLEQARKLAEKKIITGLQVESAAVAAENAAKVLEAAQAKLKSFRESRAQIVEQFDRLEQTLREGKRN